MRKTPETPEAQRARLSLTREGRALLELVDQFPTKQALAKALGTSPELISRFCAQGKISRSGAMAADSRGLMAKEALLPDETNWAAPTAGPMIGGNPDRTKPCQVLLRELSIHHGSVKAFCKAFGISTQRFHDWNSRGKVPPIALLKLVSMRELPGDIRDKIAAVVDEEYGRR